MYESVGGEALGNPNSHLWAAQQFCFCINIEELDRRGDFSWRYL